MYEEISVFEYSGVVLENLQQGVFLNTSFNNVDNTMIIGWGGVTIVWGRPVFIVLVRESRATYSLIEKSNEFTVSVPISNPLLKEIQICGSKSLRELDKFKECNLTKVKARKINTPIIGECDLHYECKVIYKQTLDAPSIPEIITQRYYKKGDIHRVYYGEIVDQYLYRKE